MKRIGELEKKYALEVLSSQFSASKATNFNVKLEREFAKKFGSKYAVTLANGTAGLHVACLVYNLKKTDEVIVPALTMSSTAISVLLAGGKPIFADVDPKTFTICPKSIKKLISKRTRGIISVSVYGLMPDYPAIQKIIKKKNIFLIEDNAECFLGKIDGKLVGNYGDFSMYSFQSSKHITCGNGGIITTNKKNLWLKAKQISNLGFPLNNKKAFTRSNIQDPNFNRHELLGLNYRLPEICAAVAYAQTKRVNELVKARIYAGKVFLDVVKKFNFVQFQVVPPTYKHTYWCFPIIIHNKKKNMFLDFKNKFIKNGGDFFYAAWKPTYREPLYKNLIKAYKSNEHFTSKQLCPIAENIQKKIIQLRTNYWNKSNLHKQAKVLEITLKEIENEIKSSI